MPNQAPGADLSLMHVRLAAELGGFWLAASAAVAGGWVAVAGLRTAGQNGPPSQGALRVS